MDNRYTIVKDLVIQACERLRKDGISVDANMIDEMVKKYSTTESSIEEVKEDILRNEKAVRINHEIDNILSSDLEVARNLQNLSVRHKGITLNNQDIDLMMISVSSSFEELEYVLSKITNISAPSIFENEDFTEYRQRVFDSYLDSLTFRNDYNANNNLELGKKLEYLMRRVSAEDATLIKKVMGESVGKGHLEIVNELVRAFKDRYEMEEVTRDDSLVLAKSRIDEFLRILRDFSPIEKTGIKSSSMEAFQELYTQVKYFYDSITIDEEGKYGKVILQNGTFEEKHLRKSLDFARSMGKSVRINTLLFYMDCPEEIYELEVNSTSKAIASEKLGFYVGNITKLIAEYDDVVRSVDIFNELLNRHPVMGSPYILRSDFPQVKGKDGNYDDNTKAGWLKHLDLDDLCGIMAIARRNLPDTDFMYNDDFLTDPNKMEATLTLVRELQEYGRGHGVQLIDSIGTQMHLDNDVTKEEIRAMFLSLKELGLPIEITEFDLAMTCGVDGLSAEDIEKIRQKKINEVFEVIEELKDECNIRGFTIWSKTDSQNFRVNLANEELIRNNMAPISTLHGGMFTEGMIPKSAEMAKSIRRQNFNYHGHTKRCGHASDLDDEVYVIAARNQGLSRIGFSDHVAFDTIENWQQGQRMHISEVDDYLTSIRKLQKNNPDMIIRCGFEVEYDPSKKGYLADLRNQCDYMILGQHYVQKGMGLVSRSDVNYPLFYAKIVCQAMDTGMFDIVAHPDYFMMERDRFSTDAEKEEFIRNASEASYMICKKAKELGIPLELNVRGSLEYKEKIDGEFAYPHSLFWNIAAEVGNAVIYGVDAHHPGHLMSIDEDREHIERHIDTAKLKFVEDDYDPVLLRSSILEDKFRRTQEDSVTHETSIVQMLLSSVEVGEGDDAFECIGDLLSAMEGKFAEDLCARLAKFDEKLADIEANSNYSNSHKEMLRKKHELGRRRIIETGETKEKLLEQAIISLSEAREVGCQTKAEYIDVIGHLIEAKTEKNLAKKENSICAVALFKESKEQGRNVTIGNTPKIYTYSSGNVSGESSSSNGSSDGGFASSINLLLVIGFLVLFGIILGFLIG